MRADAGWHGAGDAPLTLVQRSRVSTTCALEPDDFRVYDVMPHYHGLGEGLTLEAVNEAGERLGGVTVNEDPVVVGTSDGVMEIELPCSFVLPLR